MSGEQGFDPQEWMEQLVNQHQLPLIRYARSFTGDLNSARDLVQETFLRLCRQNPADVQGHEAAWLFRVCHNLALNHQRKQKRMHTGNETLLASGTSPPSSDPTASVSDGELQQMLWDSIGDLPENEQQVIRLKFHSGMSYREIADATGFSQGNVGFLLHKALKTLRHRFASQS